MLHIRLLRNEPERVKAELAKVGVAAAEVDAVLEAEKIANSKGTPRSLLSASTAPPFMP